MNIASLTWRGPGSDDVEILDELPQELATLLAHFNGFIVHMGALHVRGASRRPLWHSLRRAWRSPKAFHRLYPEVAQTDIPFAQDQMGDQFLLRHGRIFRLEAETGSVQAFCASLSEFWAGVERDIAGFLNVELEQQLEPGQLRLAWPPFTMDSGLECATLNPRPAEEVIDFHATFARRIRNLPVGAFPK